MADHPFWNSMRHKMIGRPAKIDLKYLLISALVLFAGIAGCLITSGIEQSEYQQMQLDAAMSMKNAETVLKKEILAKGIEIEKEDLNSTGLIGPEFTELTSTPGSVDAKRTTLNPNFAAAIIRYFHEAGLKKGDAVAIGTSGSFPGFVIATTIAAKEMGLKAKVIASCGSSMHGATRPEFNIFDILFSLKDNGFADFDLLAVSAGGPNDQGGGVMEGFLYEDTAGLSKQLCIEASQKSGAEFIYYDSLQDSIMRRLALFGDDVKLFVNVGGAAPNEGISSYTLNFPQGLVIKAPPIPNIINRGLCYEYAAQGIPVLNLLNVKLLAAQNGIAYDAVPQEEPGNGKVYSSFEYNVPIIMTTIALCILVLIFGVFRKKARNEGE
jgi:poly-gamma-glutamate system protein